jgi:hypothetical protein
MHEWMLLLLLLLLRNRNMLTLRISAASQLAAA